jgi:putative ABC transport system permease protein
MVSIGNGAKAQIEAQVAMLGQNIVTVMPGNFTQGAMRSGFGGATTLTPEDAEAIAAEVDGLDGVSAEVQRRFQVLANGLNWQTTVKGESPDYLYIRGWPLADGTMFGEQDVKTLAKVAVIGKTVADQLFPNEDPIGQTIRITNLPFRVIGVLAAKGFDMRGSDQDDVILIPYTSHMRRVSRQTNINTILVQGRDPENLAKVKMDIEDLLTQRRRGREPDFTVRTQEEIAETAAASSQTMTMLLAAIAGVSLVVGGIGIMNIMLVSVTERTREIGVRKALGATSKNILLQFLIEAVVLCVLGGAIGVLIGSGSAAVLSNLYQWNTTVSPDSIMLAFIFSAGVGVIFGVWPARRAAKLDPILALRYE